MRTLLTILPYAGLVLPAFSAVWGLTHELYTKGAGNQRRLTAAGRYSIAFTLLGLFISFNTGVLKTIIDSQDRVEAKAAADRQKQETTLEKLEEKARAQQLRDEQRKTQEQIDRKDQEQQKRDLSLARQQIQGFSRTEELARDQMLVEVQRAAESAEQAQRIIHDLDRSLHPFFPINMRAIFRADLRHPPYAAYRDRLVKAAPVDEESLWPELASDSPLFPDKIRERDAYSLLVAPPQMVVFFYRKAANAFMSFEKEEPDLTIAMESTSADPPLPAGKTPGPHLQIPREYAFSKDGIVSIHFPTEKVVKPYYSNGQIVSDLDLTDVMMAVEVSPWFTLNWISIELNGNREIQLREEDFRRLESRGKLIYSFRFPKDKEAFAKLFVP